MPKSPPDDSSGYYHVIIPMNSAEDFSSANSLVTIRSVSESEAYSLSRRFREIGRNQPCLCGSGRKYKKCCVQQTN